MISTQLAGTITLFFVLSLGVFVYPWLLRKRWGIGWIALISTALAGLYFFFDQGRSSVAVAASFAALWALAPVIIGLIIRRFRGT